MYVHLYIGLHKPRLMCEVLRQLGADSLLPHVGLGISCRLAGLVASVFIH